MRAIILPAADTPPALTDDLPAPAAAAGQVLVRVQASSANPVDNAIAAGLLRGMGVEHEFPVILGRDYAGVVDQVGDGVGAYAPGDRVYGFLVHANPAVHDGAWAELVAVSEGQSIAHVADGTELSDAGAAPLAGITALALLDALELGEGDTVLIVGATGGVGSFAAQLAVAAGASVIAPALPEDEGYLRNLGVTECVPRDSDVAAAVRERRPDGVDALLDLVSYEPGAFEGALKDGGRVASPTGAAGEGPGRTNVMATATRENLDRLSGLLSDGTLRVPIHASYDLADAPGALTALGTTHTQGKLAIRVA